MMFISSSSSKFYDKESYSSLYLSADLIFACQDQRKAIYGLLRFPLTFIFFKPTPPVNSFRPCCQLLAFFFSTATTLFAYILVLKSMICLSYVPVIIFMPRSLCCYFINSFCYFLRYFYTTSFQTTLLFFFYLFVGYLCSISCEFRNVLDMISYSGVRYQILH